MNIDWRNATCYWISQILEGDLSLNQIESNSYWRLEEIWLKEVKELRAYYIWEKRWKEKGLELWSLGGLDHRSGQQVSFRIAVETSQG